MACGEPEWWYRQMQEKFDWESGFTPNQRGTWTTSTTASSPAYFMAEAGTFTQEDIQKLLGAKNGQVVAMKDPMDLCHIFYEPADGHCHRVYMGTEAYQAFTKIAIRESAQCTANPPQLCEGMPIIVLAHLPPMAVICHQNIREIVRQIENEAVQERIDLMMRLKDQQKNEAKLALVATSIYRLEEPQHLWRMALIGAVIGSMLMAAYWLILGR